MSSGLIEKIYISRNQFRINCEHIFGRFHCWWHKRQQNRFRKLSANPLALKLMIATWCCCDQRKHSFSCYARSLQWKWLLAYAFCVVCVRDVLFCCWKWLLSIFPAALSALELLALAEVFFIKPFWPSPWQHLYPKHIFSISLNSLLNAKIHTFSL